MDTVRNFIHVIGITPENELPRNPAGQVIQYSDIETIPIPEDKPGAKSIFQIMLQVDITSTRIVNTPLSRTMLIEGVRNIKIIYTENGGNDNANFLTLSVPYNTFIDIPKEYSEPESIEVFVLDAYFSLLDSRHIYSYLLYLVHASYGDKPSKKEVKRNDAPPSYKIGQPNDIPVDIDAEYL